MPALLLSLLIALIAAGGCRQTTLSPYSRTFHVFGTTVNVTLYAAHPRQASEAFRAVHATFRRFHRDWHAWRPGGLLARINTAIARGEAITIPDDAREFIQYSQALTRASGGLFDPGIGALIDLWGFHGETWHGPPPDEATLAEWRAARPSLLDVVFDGNRLHSRQPRVRLDFGGNAKGLALQQALARLRAHDIRHAIVNIGGDMMALGNRPDGTPWRIGVQDPFDPDRIRARIVLHGGEAVVTSGTYRRYFLWQGRRYSHLLDPTTGRPVPEGLVSVTVIHRDPIRADAAATALLIAGPTRWQQVAERMAVDQVAVIHHTGRVEMTPAMQHRWQPLPASSSP